jgi:hypothetical protein
MNPRRLIAELRLRAAIVPAQTSVPEGGQWEQKTGKSASATDDRSGGHLCFAAISGANVGVIIGASDRVRSLTSGSYCRANSSSREAVDRSAVRRDKFLQ